MAIRIREVVIRAEISSDVDKEMVPKWKGPSPKTVSKSDIGIITNSFYEQDLQKDNER